ncbi:hypothetical protein D3C71_1692670 [compost metagenome]
MVNQPASSASSPDGPIHRMKYRKGRDWYSPPRQRSHRLHTPARIISMPSATMMRNDQNTTVELGRSSGGKDFSAGTCSVRL